MRTSWKFVVLIFTVLVVNLQATDNQCLEAKEDRYSTSCSPGKILLYGKCIDKNKKRN